MRAGPAVAEDIGNRSAGWVRNDQREVGNCVREQILHTEKRATAETENIYQAMEILFLKIASCAGEWPERSTTSNPRFLGQLGGALRARRSGRMEHFEAIQKKKRAQNRLFPQSMGIGYGRKKAQKPGKEGTERLAAAKTERRQKGAHVLGKELEDGLPSPERRKRGKGSTTKQASMQSNPYEGKGREVSE